MNYKDLSVFTVFKYCTKVAYMTIVLSSQSVGIALEQRQCMYYVRSFEGTFDTMNNKHVIFKRK